VVCILVFFLEFLFFVYNIFFFWFWDTRRWTKSKNTLRLMLTHNRQKPTKGGCTSAQFIHLLSVWGTLLCQTFQQNRNNPARCVVTGGYRGAFLWCSLYSHL